MKKSILLNGSKFRLSILSVWSAAILMISVNLSVAQHEEEPEEDKGLFIVTETDKISAGLARRLQEGPSSPGDNMSESVDKQRKVVGIGEGVKLTLDGKRKGDDAKVTWSYVGNAAAYVELPDPAKGNSVRMTVKKNLTSDQSVTIKATNEKGESRDVSFSLKIPSGFKGTHQKVVAYDPSNSQAGVIPELRDDAGRIVNPQPGETGSIGASATLIVTVQPIEVSFEDILIIERANDPKGFKPEHKPNTNPMKLSDCNRFSDDIFATSYSLPGDPVPKGWTWQCAYMLLENNSDLLKITGRDVEQTASFSRTGTASEPGIETTVTKFDCSVSRDSRTGEHKFTPSTYQP